MIFTDWNTAPPDTTVCYCNEVSLREIRKAIEDGARTIEGIQEMTGACTGSMCEEKNPRGGCCETDILKIISIFGGGAPLSSRCKCCG